MNRYTLDTQNTTQLVKILSKKILPSKKVLNIKHDIHPETGKAHVLISSLHPLSTVEQEIKKFMFLHGKIIFPLQLIPIK